MSESLGSVHKYLGGHRGRLYKMGHVIKTWRPRFFVLEKRKIRYFADETMFRLNGEFSVNENTLIFDVPGEIDGRKFLFFICAKDASSMDEIMYLSAQSQRDKLEWMEAIADASQNGFKLVQQPDLYLDPFYPSVDVQIYYESSFVHVEYSNLIKPSMVEQRPQISLRGSETSAAYSLLMIDIDSVRGQGEDLDARILPKKTYLHWAVVNIEGPDITLGTEIVPYECFAPEYDSGLHRVFFVVFRQNFVITSSQIAELTAMCELRVSFPYGEWLRSSFLGEPVGLNGFYGGWEESCTELHAHIGYEPGEEYLIARQDTILKKEAEAIWIEDAKVVLFQDLSLGDIFPVTLDITASGLASSISLQIQYEDGESIGGGSELTPISLANDAPYVDYIPHPADICGFVSGTNSVAVDSGLYSLLMVDADATAPSHDQASEPLVECVHWVVCNIPGNAVADGAEILPYLSPASLPGTGMHRYVFSLYKQKKALTLQQLDSSRSFFSRRLGIKSYDWVRLLSSALIAVPVGLEAFLAKSGECFSASLDKESRNTAAETHFDDSDFNLAESTANLPDEGFDQVPSILESSSSGEVFDHNLVAQSSNLTDEPNHDGSAAQNTVGLDSPPSYDSLDEKPSLDIPVKEVIALVPQRTSFGSIFLSQEEVDGGRRKPVAQQAALIELVESVEPHQLQSGPSAAEDLTVLDSRRARAMSEYTLTSDLLGPANKTLSAFNYVPKGDVAFVDRSGSSKFQVPLLSFNKATSNAVDSVMSPLSTGRSTGGGLVREAKERIENMKKHQQEQQKLEFKRRLLTQQNMKIKKTNSADSAELVQAVPAAAGSAAAVPITTSLSEDHHNRTGNPNSDSLLPLREQPRQSSEEDGFPLLSGDSVSTFTPADISQWTEIETVPPLLQRADINLSHEMELYQVQSTSNLVNATGYPHDELDLLKAEPVPVLMSAPKAEMTSSSHFVPHLSMTSAEDSTIVSDLTQPTFISAFPKPSVRTHADPPSSVDGSITRKSLQAHMEFDDEEMEQVAEPVAPYYLRSPGFSQKSWNAQDPHHNVRQQIVEGSDTVNRNVNVSHETSSYSNFSFEKSEHGVDDDSLGYSAVTELPRQVVNRFDEPPPPQTNFATSFADNTEHKIAPAHASDKQIVPPSPPISTQQSSLSPPLSPKHSTPSRHSPLPHHYHFEEELVGVGFEEDDWGHDEEPVYGDIEDGEIGQMERNKSQETHETMSTADSKPSTVIPIAPSTGASSVRSSPNITPRSLEEKESSADVSVDRSTNLNVSRTSSDRSLSVTDSGTRKSPGSLLERKNSRKNMALSTQQILMEGIMEANDSRDLCNVFGVKTQSIFDGDKLKKKFSSDYMYKDSILWIDAGRKTLHWGKAINDTETSKFVVLSGNGEGASGENKGSYRFAEIVNLTTVVITLTSGKSLEMKTFGENAGSAGLTNAIEKALDWLKVVQSFQ